MRLNSDYTLGSLFTGIGGLDLGVEMVFGPANRLWVSDIVERDKKGHIIGNAPAVIEKRFPGVPNLGDVTKIDWDSVPRVDVLTGGSPCFTADVPVLTSRGYRPIADVRAGDLVLTHENRWRTVTATMTRESETVEFAPGFMATPEHRFWLREPHPVWRNEIKRYKRVLGEPEWREVKSSAGTFGARPVTIPPLVGIPDLPEDFTFWHLGRWVADGWIGRNDEPIISIGKKKFERDQKMFGDLWIPRVEPTSIKMDYRHGGLGEWFGSHFGSGASGRTLPAWLLSAPVEDRREFLEGYWSGDGYAYRSHSMRSASVSPCLTVGIQTLAETLGYTATLHYNRTAPTTVIEGRTVNQRNWWSVTATPDDHRYTEVIGDHRWSKFRKEPKPSGIQQVYDISVDEDHSFIAAGFVVHNCQDLSVGGRRAGMMPGTRSGLWVSMFEGIKKLRPHLVVWENVRGAYSAKAYSSMESGDGRVVLRGLGRVLGDLAGIGYDAGWCGVRASEVGAPHQRFRVFVLAWPKDDNWWRERKMYSCHIPSEPFAPIQLLPTPTARDGKGRNQRNDDSCLWGAVEQHTRGSYFGPYQAAVDGWSRVFRPAPAPAEPATKPGKYRLNAEFPEWMMGFPNGWVTDVGLSRMQEFRAIGGAVVPQQAALAITKIAYTA